MEPCSPLINFTDCGDGGSLLGPFHDSPSTPRNVERSLLDDDTGLEQSCLGVPLIGSGNQVDDLAIFSQAIDSLKSVFVDTVAWQKKWFEENAKLCSTDIPKETLTLVEKAQTDFLEVLNDRMQNFTKQTIDVIKWNAKQSCTEFKELVDEANHSLFSSFKTAIKEHGVNGKELQEEMCSLRQQVFTMQTSLDALMQKGPQ
ncbi:MAG: hypothetical protein ACRCVL_08135, partial [Cetobacterium sp.]